MALGYPEGKEPDTTIEVRTRGGRFPWRRTRNARRDSKAQAHRRERRRVKRDPEHLDEYKRSKGWEW